MKNHYSEICHIIPERTFLIIMLNVSLQLVPRGTKKCSYPTINFCIHTRFLMINLKISYLFVLLFCYIYLICSSFIFVRNTYSSDTFSRVKFIIPFRKIRLALHKRVQELLSGEHLSISALIYPIPSKYAETNL